MTGSLRGTAERSPLGKPSAYCSHYAPELLFPIPRAEKRREIGIDEASLPFLGEDIWNAYEISWLNEKGKPLVAIGEFRVPAHSPCIVESKSLKLYLNSFNQTAFGSLEEVRQRIARDLSQAAGAEVSVSLQTPSSPVARPFAIPAGLSLDDLDIETRTYSPDPALIALGQGRQVEDQTLYSHLLKSNCLVTGQPDWAMLAVRYSGPAIDLAGLLRYIVSYREHNEFHEQCVERIFVDISERCQPRDLAVWARYTRRGGLDINPSRSTRRDWLPLNAFEGRQ